MPRILRWRDVPGNLIVVVGAFADGVWDVQHDRELPMLSGELPTGSEFVMCVDFLSTGFYDPGVCSGSPEECRIPDGEDVRTLDSVWLGQRELLKDLAEQVFEAYTDEIQAVELDRTRE
jgi:hypothetical protein